MFKTLRLLLFGALIGAVIGALLNESAHRHRQRAEHNVLVNDPEYVEMRREYEEKMKDPAYRLKQAEIEAVYGSQ